MRPLIARRNERKFERNITVVRGLTAGLFRGQNRKWRGGSGRLKVELKPKTPARPHFIERQSVGWNLDAENKRPNGARRHPRASRQHSLAECGGQSATPRRRLRGRAGAVRWGQRRRRPPASETTGRAARTEKMEKRSSFSSKPKQSSLFSVQPRTKRIEIQFRSSSNHKRRNCVLEEDKWEVARAFASM